MTFVLDVLSERMCILIGVFLMTSAYTLSSLVMSFPVFVFTLGAVSGKYKTFFVVVAVVVVWFCH